MRKDWFEHVQKTRKKLSRGKKVPIAHVAAMKAASVTWPTVKAKLIRKRERECKKLAKDKLESLTEDN